MRSTIERVVREALAEDVGRGDITTEAVVPADLCVRARVIARQRLVVAGLDAARGVFAQVSPEVTFTPLACDGNEVPAETPIARVEGPSRAILMGERVSLNLLMHLSGIATITREYVRAVEDTGARVVDTRKTTPGLRELEKAAVRAGGGSNHRFGLDDGVLIKDNHVAMVGGVAEAVHRARRGAHHLLKIEVEVEALGELREALAAGADAVLLDNMTPEQVCEAVALARRERPGVIVEVSGGVNLETVREYAEAGPDLISVGALTHSALAVDVSLEVEAC